MTSNEMKSAYQDIEQWADSRNTSVEIVMAILDLSKTEEICNRIWEDPTSSEIEAIRERAFRLTEEDELYWGKFETLERS